MSNYPLGTENDSRAPWNQEEPNYDDLVSEARSALANEASDLLYDIIKEITTDWDTQEYIYDELYSELKRIWER